jgi:[NiFe] hydrogenase assembly HybE family chaperone
MSEGARRLEVAFENIARTRMAGLPFLNPQLRVEAVGFREWEGQWIGVLITPWSMNVVLLPGAGPWPRVAPGIERSVDLPAGRFRFIAATDPGLGDYHACSLFSPALEFASHAAARATAEAALVALFDAGNGAEVAPPAPVSRRDFLRGRRSEAQDADRG